MSTTTPARPTPQELNNCLSHPRRTVMTTAGPMEYAERGQGLPLLSVHGTPGGCDQGLVFSEYFRANGFRVIAPSRPGYLGTPLGTGRSQEAQADAMAALLDALGIERVAAVAASGGGPSGYLLAARHPGLVSCLLQVDSLCLPLRGHPTLERLAWSRVGVWLMLWLLDHFPARMVRMFQGKPSDLDHEELTWRAQSILADPVHMSFMRTLTLSGAGWPARREGYENDNAAFAALTPVPLDAITCPTLIMHGTADTSVPPAHAEYAHGQISGSELYWIRGSHLGFGIDEGDQAQQHALSWLADHMR